MTSFDEFYAELEAEAEAEGPDAVAELRAFELFFSREAERLDRASESSRLGSNAEATPPENLL